MMWPFLRKPKAYSKTDRPDLEREGFADFIWKMRSVTSTFSKVLDDGKHKR